MINSRIYRLVTTGIFMLGLGFFAVAIPTSDMMDTRAAVTGLFFMILACWMRIVEPRD